MDSDNSFNISDKFNNDSSSNLSVEEYIYKVLEHEKSSNKIKEATVDF